MFNLLNVFGKHKDAISMTKEEMAELLKTTPKALEEFENAYKKYAINADDGSYFSVSAKQMSDSLDHTTDVDTDVIIKKIVNELLAQTYVFSYEDGKINAEGPLAEEPTEFVTLEEVMNIKPELRPQVTGNMLKKDIADDSYKAILFEYQQSKTAKTPKERLQHYHMFRQGLDILDLDAITYEIIGTNPNSIGHWFPQLAEAINEQSFFKLPNTKFIKVPVTLLQLTRTEYEGLTPTTLKIVDDFCMKAFKLDENKEYFVKTGTYSSKFDFRNAHVYGPKEVRELGEYLLYIHHSALNMASPLCTPCIYGVSTTNEWAVREFIPDVENNPCIYKGMPLRTEYRLFVDFDENKVLGMSPYWEPNTMKSRFSKSDDADSPHQQHDYIIYLAHEEKLMGKYEENKQKVYDAIEKMLPTINLFGQWSIDVMQNGNDFYIIDMALAENSALKECVPDGLIKHIEENWIPELQG